MAESFWSSYLPAPSPGCWPHGAACRFSTSAAAATFENDALASALARASSMSPSPSSSPTPSTSTTTTSSASELSSSVPHVDARPLPAPLSGTPVAAASGARPGPRPQARCRTGRVMKRKPRPSRRAPVTYVTADPADFRRMVQEITGFQSPGADRAEWPAPPPIPPPGLAFVLPTLDTSASFLVDRAPPQPQPEEDNTSSGCRAATASSADEWSLALMQELEATVAVASAFPTLDSCWGWGMI